MNPAWVVFVPYLAFILTLLLGLGLSRLGRPYPGWLFNFHKLVALAGVVFGVWQLAQRWQAASLAWLWWFGLVCAGLAILALFASGALLSIGKFDYSRLKLIHRVAPGLLVLAWVIFWLG